jgi:molybdate/tungstate transport system substrate-binding protein
MTRGANLAAVIGGLVLALVGGGAQADQPVHLKIFAAGTLAQPFQQLDALFRKQYPNVIPEPRFGGSVKMAREITELHQPADVLAVADYSVIPKYLFPDGGKPGYADWYVGFARNAITFMYTKNSKYAAEVTPDTWYRVLARHGVEIGRSNPDTDPSGYQTLQMLQLAGRYYRDPKLAEQILANAPPANMRDTETSLIAALQLGQIDYLAIYRSDALQHHLNYIDLPAAIDLSDPKDADLYKQAVADTQNGKLPGRPIVYAVTIPAHAPDAEWAAKYVALLLGPEGQRIMQQNGFGTMVPPYAVNATAMPASLQPLVKPWPGS